MTERPIIFSAAMVRAILAGTKTQTRRIIKPSKYVAATWGAEIATCPSARVVNLGAEGTWFNFDHPGGGPYIAIKSPYRPGDTLWVREAWMEACELDENDDPASELRIYYRADGRPFDRYLDPDTGSFTDRLPWRPSIHMPRRASRITLRVTAVRVERLQDISEEDAQAEGVEPEPVRVFETPHTPPAREARPAFASLWESIHGPGAWSANPWVVAVSFERVRSNG